VEKFFTIKRSSLFLQSRKLGFPSFGRQTFG
jgi:hypothetical protein